MGLLPIIIPVSAESAEVPAEPDPNAPYTYDSVSFDASGLGTFVSALFFKSDGTKMYLAEGIDDTVAQYSLSTAWNVSTASSDGVSLSVSSPLGVAFSTNGTRLYTVNAFDTIRQYNLSTAWDLSSLSYSGTAFEPLEVSASIRGVAFKADDQKLYLLDSADVIYQYSVD